MSITLDIPNYIHEALHVTPAEAEARLKLELQDFVNCVRKKHAPIVSGESAKRALDLAFEITRQIQQIR